ncbi:polyhydroxyalkanoate depolymerase [Curvivirga aplysinae]|uniref:polyhydroxyalkanoate depolymerase n=1 Tax=Curvivirga aplysinae TaxID=2529852 RepID=UPI0012BD18F6|nr:polyhydroxyalkanoate depolymerase [Curvivirga aplysinae]
MIVLYSFYDTKVQAMEPLRIMAEATEVAFSHPWNPWSYTPIGKSIAAGSHVMESLLRERGKPDWMIDTAIVDGKETPVTIETVVHKAFGDLVHFKREGVKEGTHPKLLLVAPMSGHYATLLRGTVQALIDDHEVYVTDWRDASEIPMGEGKFGVEKYISYVIKFLKYLGKDAHVMAVCQPAPLVLAAVSVLAMQDSPYQPKTMTLMGGPLDTRAASTVVTELADKHDMNWFRRNCIHVVPLRFEGAGRRVYPGFMQLHAFLSMNPKRHTVAQWKMFTHLVEGDGDSAEAHRKFYDEYLAVMDTAADFYLETIDAVFKRHLLPRGLFRYKGDLVDTHAIKKTALLTVEGALDDISAPGQTIAAHEMCSNIPATMKKNHLQDGVGHYGIFNGRKWREIIKPEIAAFIRKHG